MYLQHQWQGTRGTGWWNQEWTLNHRHILIWISSLRFGVRSWVKIVKVGHEVSVIQKYWVWTSSKALVGTIMPTPRVVVLVGEIFQNDLNFSLEQYRSWWKKERICKIFEFDRSEFLILPNICWARTAKKRLPPNTQTSWYPPVTCEAFLHLSSGILTGPQGAKNKKKGFQLRQLKSSHYRKRGVSSHAKISGMWSCWRYIDLLLCFRAGCYLSKLQEVGWWIWWIWQIWWDIKVY